MQPTGRALRPTGCTCISTTPGTMKSHKPERKLDLTPTQVTGSALAAMSGAFFASWAGTAGTIIGAALGSVIVTVGAATYTWSLQRTRDAVRRTAAQVRQQALTANAQPQRVADGPLREPETLAPADTSAYAFLYAGPTTSSATTAATRAAPAEPSAAATTAQAVGPRRAALATAAPRQRCRDRRHAAGDHRHRSRGRQARSPPSPAMTPPAPRSAAPSAAAPAGTDDATDTATSGSSGSSDSASDDRGTETDTGSGAGRRRRRAPAARTPGPAPTRRHPSRTPAPTPAPVDPDTPSPDPEPSTAP